MSGWKLQRLWKNLTDFTTDKKNKLMQMTEENVKNIPKIDMHCHLEGMFKKEALWLLSQKYNPEVTWVEFFNKFNINNFQSFIEAWEYKNSLIRNIEDFEFLCDNIIQDLYKENVVYIELTISPFGIKNLVPHEVVEVVSAKFKQTSIDYVLIGDIVRNTDIKLAHYKYDFYKEMKYCGINAIGLGGDEKKYSPLLFSNLLKKAKEEGYYISIHAGEFGDERNIYESIRHCFADRIGHGNNINNTELIKLIKNKGILIELCPCSNSIINKNFNINKYNFYTYLQKGIAISINSDDPGLLGKTISDNYLYILKNFKVDVTDLIKIEKNAIKHLFCSNIVKDKLIRLLNSI